MDGHVHTDRASARGIAQAMILDASVTTSDEPVNSGASAAGSATGAGARHRLRVVTSALLAADVAGLVLAFVASELLFGAGDSSDHVSRTFESIAFLVSLPLWIVGAKAFKLYDYDAESVGHTTVEDFWRVFNLVPVGSWLFYLGSWATGLAEPTVRKLVSFWLLAIVLVTLLRAVARSAAHRSATFTQNALIIGAGDVGQLIARKLLQHAEYGIHVVGFVDSRPKALRSDLGSVDVVGEPDQLGELLDRYDVDRVIVAFTDEAHEREIELVGMLKRRDIQIDIVPRLYEVVGPHVRLHSVEGLPLVGLPATKRFPASRVIKRAIDLAGASIGLALASPLFLYAAWRIPRESEGPVFFRQTRLGLGGREFVALKFRTMRTGSNDDAHREYVRQISSADTTPTDTGLYKLERPDLVTPFGRFLRGTSLDELPQLINVLRGEMSLVGPRPCMPYELELFEPQHYERFDVPAGITGLWQVTARAHSSFGEALDMDVQYARNWSLTLDLWLLLRTPFHMMRKSTS
jgi:exopolysaccharide biosynthesis polyprenyl glycosylphosphotransferase